jgi:hypothetical protein
MAKQQTLLLLLCMLLLLTLLLLLLLLPQEEEVGVNCALLIYFPFRLSRTSVWIFWKYHFIFCATLDIHADKLNAVSFMQTAVHADSEFH